jgi:hypothetical protein
MAIGINSLSNILGQVFTEPLLIPIPPGMVRGNIGSEVYVGIVVDVHPRMHQDIYDITVQGGKGERLTLEISAYALYRIVGQQERLREHRLFEHRNAIDILEGE